MQSGKPLQVRLHVDVFENRGAQSWSFPVPSGTVVGPAFTGMAYGLETLLARFAVDIEGQVL